MIQDLIPFPAYTRPSPQSIYRAIRLLDACWVLETPPLPVTLPQRRDRGHDLMPESSFLLTFSSTNLRLRVAITPRLSRRGPTVSFHIHSEPLAGRGQAGGDC
jgi:hypothetical protein